MKKVILLLLVSSSLFAQRTISQDKVKNLSDSLAKKVDKIAGKGLSANDYTTAEKTKLAGIATGATANSTDAQLRDRTTHTGVQEISTIVGLQDSLSNHVKKNAAYIAFPSQSSIPATPTNGFRLYANTSNALSWKGANGFVRTFDGTSNTADRSYTLQNASGTIPLLEIAQTWSGINTFGGSDNTTQFIATSNNKSFRINPANNLMGSSHGWRFDVNIANTQTQALQIFSNGNFVLQNGGTFIDSGYRLDVNGTGRFTSAVIGSSSYGGDLNVFGSTGIIYGNASGTGIAFADGGSTRLGSRSNHRLDFVTNSITRASIDISGNLGIGTTSPNSKLQVSNGNIETDNSANGLILKSPDGTRYLIKVANGGTLTATAL